MLTPVCGNIPHPLGGLLKVVSAQVPSALLPSTKLGTAGAHLLLPPLGCGERPHPFPTKEASAMLTPVCGAWEQNAAVMAAP
jgi:hypothetical protein